MTYFDEILSTTLSSQNILDKAIAQRDRILPILPEYLAKLGRTKTQYQSAFNGFVKHIGSRPMEVLKRLQTYFGFSNEEMLQRFPKALEAIKAYSEAH